MLTSWGTGALSGGKAPVPQLTLLASKQNLREEMSCLNTSELSAVLVKDSFQ